MSGVKKAGRIKGDPICGLCYREVIEVNKVYDGCIGKYNDVTYSVKIPEVRAAVPPYRFISAKSSGETIISNLRISPIDDWLREVSREQNERNRLADDAAENPQSREDRRRYKACVSFDTDIPIVLEFSDEKGEHHRAYSHVPLHRDVELHIPPDSLTPFKIQVNSSLVCNVGSFITPTELSLKVCILQVTKVTAKVDVLVPTYGYCEYPACTGQGRDCEDIINTLPLFPPFL